MTASGPTPVDAETKKARIERINELSQLARTAWFTLMGYLVFVGITLLGVKDADFFVPSRQTDLPLVNVAIPTASFFWTAPVLGAALYIYLHLFLIKLWDAHGEARTQDADGTHHWLVNDFALIRQGDKAARARPLWWLNDWVTRLLVWIAGPFVLAFAWWRSMPAHNEWLTLLIGLCLWLSLVVGFTSWWRAQERLRDRSPGRWTGALRQGTAFLAALLLVAASWLRTEGGLDHTVNLIIDFYERTTRHSLFSAGEYANGDEKPAQEVQEEWTTAWFPTLETFTYTSDTPLIGRWIETDWSPLAATDLTDVALVPLAPDWRTPETARTAFRETWCKREGLSMEICDQPAGPDHETPRYVTADRATWCREHGPLGEAECTARFADLDQRFAIAWEEERRRARNNLTALDLRGRDLRRARASVVSLIGADLRGARMEGANLRGAWMEGANLSGARMEGAFLIGARMEGADLSEARMQGANLREARMEGAFLIGARMEDTNLLSARMERANLRGARMEGAFPIRARMERADLRRARMEGANLSGARMEGANFSEARMEKADLRGARMDGAFLIRARMGGADLRGARMVGAFPIRARMEGTDLRGTEQLTQAQLEQLIGNENTLLPDGQALDTGQPYYIWSCWEASPEEEIEAIGERLAEFTDAAELLCNGTPPRKLYNGLALDAPYPDGHPLANREE